MPDPDTPARRTRHDGWTEDRKAAFVEALGRGGSIAAAAASVGMSRRSAYRLRARADGVAVAAAWGVDLPAPEARRASFDAVIAAAHDRLEARLAAAAADPRRFDRWLMTELRDRRKRRFASTCVTFSSDDGTVARPTDVNA